MSYQKLHRIASRLRQLANETSDAGNPTDLEAVVAITGIPGSGKSTCGIQIGKIILGNQFTLKGNVAWTKEHVETMMRTKKNSVIIITEAIMAAYKQDWQRSFSKKLNKRITRMRVNHNVVIFCIPRLWDLSEMLRNQSISFWIDCMRWVDVKKRGVQSSEVDVKVIRGEAAFMEKVYSPRHTDPWDTRKLDKAFKVLDRGKFDYNRYKNCYRNYRPFFKGYFKFPDLQKNLKEKFKKIDSDYKTRPDDDDSTKEIKWRTKCIEERLAAMNKFKDMGLLNKDIARIYGKTHGWVTRMFNNEMHIERDE